MEDQKPEEPDEDLGHSQQCTETRTHSQDDTQTSDAHGKQTGVVGDERERHLVA